MCTICVQKSFAVSRKSSYFAVDMKRNKSLLLLLMVGLNASAQRQMFVCQGYRCDAFETGQSTVMTFTADSMQVGQLPPYNIGEVDSILFSQPQLSTRQLGWWGNVSDGHSDYKARIEDTWGRRYDVDFSFEATNGICRSAHCTLLFDEEWMLENYLMIEATDSGGDDPYIYVKETLTGPRRYEKWVMDDPVLPDHKLWEGSGTVLQADCRALLADRAMSDVQQIVEAWLFQKGTPILKTEK